MLTLTQVVTQIRSEDCLVTIEGMYPCTSMYPSFHNTGSSWGFAFGGKPYQYWVLPFGLALSPHTFTKCVDAALAPLWLQGICILNYINNWLILAQLRCHPCPYKKAGVKVWCGIRPQWGHICLLLGSSQSSQPWREREKACHSLSLFQRLLGLMATASNVIPFDLLYMRPLQWWLRTKGFSSRGNPLQMIKVTWWCLHPLDMWRKPCFLSQGPVLGAPCHRVTLTTDASFTAWGAVMSGPFYPGSVGRSPSHVAHKLPGDAGHVSGSETLSPRPERPSCACSHRQHISGLLHQPPGGRIRTLYRLARQILLLA